MIAQSNMDAIQHDSRAGRGRMRVLEARNCLVLGWVSNSHPALWSGPMAVSVRGFITVLMLVGSHPTLTVVCYESIAG